SYIGAGAYGKVYHAYWHGRKVAIKQFTMAQANAASEIAIQREVRLLESLRDKHIIQFYGTTEYEGQLVLVMEYAEGGSLDGAIQSCQLDWATKMRIAQEVVRGLAFIHHQDVLHRDLKSMNVLLTRHMEVKLCDFGVATVKIRSASKSTTSTKGTLRWMAPELLVAKPKYSTKSDMFALGMVMWELAANCTIPFKDQLSSVTVMGLVQNGEREVLPDDTPPDFRQWVERCWAQDPAKRPDAREMVTKDEEPNGGGRFASPQGFLSCTVEEPDLTLSPPPGKNETVKGDQVAKLADDLGPLLEKANADDVEAQLALAEIYQGGLGVDQNHTEAFKWYLRAAELGSTLGQYMAGDCLMYGRGTSVNHERVAYWMQLAADNGHPRAQDYIGWMYESGHRYERDYDQAFSWFSKAAVQADAKAQYHLGLMYKKGNGVERDYDQAMAWFRKSADQEYEDALYHIGLMYKEGEGVQRDYEQALSWLHRSAVQGSANAQCHVGLMYMNSQGVEEDFGKALSWYRKSADQGNVAALCNLGLMYKDGLGVERDYGEALSWYLKSAEKGNANAQYHVGWIYKNGKGVERDYGEALSWYRKSADQGNPNAQNEIGSMYQNAHGVHMDIERAITWYRKAAKQNHASAIRRLESLE
ncbi:hypothetical protein DFQ27_006576, partial [Actinomortierella ambigua]